MKFKYNAPVTLTFSLLCFAIFATSDWLFPALGIQLNPIETLFTVPSSVSFDPSSAASYILLFTHIFGHADWNHLIGNLSFILILGPLLESAYGSASLALMILITAFVTGVINVCFFSSPLLGASGVVFMMVLLSAFTNRKKKEIPLTFILVVLLFMGREIAGAFEDDNVSRFAHLVGGLCGSLFGFFTAPEQAGRARKSGKKGWARSKYETSSGAAYDPGAATPQIKLVRRNAEEHANAGNSKKPSAKKRLASFFRRNRKTGIPEVDAALSDFEKKSKF